MRTTDLPENRGRTISERIPAILPVCKYIVDSFPDRKPCPPDTSWFLGRKDIQNAVRKTLRSTKCPVRSRTRRSPNRDKRCSLSPS